MHVATPSFLCEGLLLLLLLGCAHCRCPAMWYGAECNVPRPNLPECVGSRPYSGPLTLTRGGVRRLQQTRSPYAPHPPLQPSELLLLPPSPLAGATFPAPSCALVSSAPSLRFSGLGAAVDAHQLVLRINDAPTRGFERHVGNRTDTRLANWAHEGFREKPTEAAVGAWCAGPLLQPACAKASLLRMLGKKIHPLHPGFVRWIRNPFFHAKRHVPTSGYVAAMLLLHMCQKVTLYGMNLDPKTIRKPAVNKWYFPKQAARPAAGKELFKIKATARGEWVYADGRAPPPGETSERRSGDGLTSLKPDAARPNGVERRLLSAAGAAPDAQRSSPQGPQPSKQQDTYPSIQVRERVDRPDPRQHADEVRGRAPTHKMAAIYSRPVLVDTRPRPKPKPGVFGDNGFGRRATFHHPRNPHPFPNGEATRPFSRPSRRTDEAAVLHAEQEWGGAHKGTVVHEKQCLRELMLLGLFESAAD